MQEKKYIKRLIIGLLAVTVIYLAVQAVLYAVNGKVYEDVLITREELGACPLEDLRLTMDGDGAVHVEQMTETDGAVVLRLVADAAGPVDLRAYAPGSSDETAHMVMRVSRTGTITNLENGNYGGYKTSRILLAVLLCVVTAMLWISGIGAYRKFRFSYHCIFCIGLGIWIAIITVLMFIGCVNNWNMLSFYSMLERAANWFILLSLPVVVLFSFFMMISNISLIRHEGFRINNALGIILGAAMIFGAVLIIVLDSLFSSGLETQARFYGIIMNLLDSAYVLLECFLIGSVICGISAARHEPDYDKDYIVILGCKIRKDGTLYPLIRGRVDRALEFADRQQKSTGKAAVFVPSGGQGRDEVIPEAEAMKRYLVSRGIGEERILVEDQSVNTRQNMQFSQKLIKERTPGAKTAFSTTNYHVFRSGIIASQVDFPIDGMGSRTKWYFWPNAFVREVIGMVSYKWKTLLLLMVPVIAFFSVILIVF